MSHKFCSHFSYLPWDIFSFSENLKDGQRPWGGGCQEIPLLFSTGSWMLLITTGLEASMAARRDDVNQSWTCCRHSSQEGRCTTCVYIIRRVWHQTQPPPPSSWGNSKLAVALLQDSRESEGPSGWDRTPEPLLFSKMALRILTYLHLNNTLHSASGYRQLNSTAVPAPKHSEGRKMFRSPIDQDGY